MSITLEMVAGLVLTSAVVTIFTVLAAFELGRLVTRDEAANARLRMLADGGSESLEIDFENEELAA